MKLEPANTDEGQDRLDKAKDRLDTRTAEIGQQILEENAEAMQPEGGSCNPRLPGGVVSMRISSPRVELGMSKRTKMTSRSVRQLR